MNGEICANCGGTFEQHGHGYKCGVFVPREQEIKTSNNELCELCETPKSKHYKDKYCPGYGTYQLFKPSGLIAVKKEFLENMKRFEDLYLHLLPDIRYGLKSIEERLSRFEKNTKDLRSILQSIEKDG